jgi:NAD(P)H-nitrite reductase large subunit
VKTVNFHDKTINLSETNQTLKYDKLILATGSKTNKFGWQGQDFKGVSGLYSKQDLEYIEQISPDIKNAVIVGGGLIGIELAEMLVTRNINVTMVVREKSYWANVLPPEESEMINQHIISHKITLKKATELQEIKGDINNKVVAVILKDGTEIACDFVGITTGVSPNIDFLKDSALKIDKGILVNDLLETNVENVYAIGDCAQIETPSVGRKSIEAVWYTGRMMGEVAAHNVCGETINYQPGIWFNSAKFFDIEYQVYGFVPVVENENFGVLFWSNGLQNKSIRIVFNNQTKQVVGFNLMGIRYRHEVCEKWIHEKTPIEVVLKNLSLANFDPEFFKSYEAEIVTIYNTKVNQPIELSSNKSLDSVIQFLNS